MTEVYLVFIAYLVGIVLGFAIAFDMGRQAKEWGYNFDTKGQLIRWIFNPKKKDIHLVSDMKEEKA